MQGENTSPQRADAPRWPYALAAFLLAVGLVPTLLGYTRHDYAGLIPRGDSMAWTPVLLLLHSTSDLTTGLSYVAISAMLIYLVNSLR